MRWSEDVERMEAEFRDLERRVRGLIQRVRELEAERSRLEVKISELERLRETAAARLNGILERLEEPE